VSKNTVAAYKQDIQAFGKFLEENGCERFEDVTNTQIVSYLMELKQTGKSKATVNRKLASIRAFYRYLISQGVMRENPTEGIKSPKISRKEISYLSIDEIEKLLDAPDDSVKGKRDKAMLEIRTSLQERVRAVGIEIVDVRLKRVDFTPQISESVYRRMEAERKRVASEERSTGAAEAEKIRASADRQSEVILAEAYRDAQKIKGEGDAEATSVYAKAFGASPEFARFYRSLDKYRESFGKPSDMMVVDSNSEFFTYLKKSEQ
jgi:HflC protein